MKSLIIVAALLTVVPASASAHSGGTDREGCHRDSRTGIRHCHGGGRSSAAPSRPQALSSSAGGAFANCAAARAAGAAPVRRGEPGYGRHLDRDGDGVGCE
ncbi:excalibur calcium-binding domain-containing protein [Brevundimonas goettingensis]|uniref:Excalibur calcium-binding domain-containing protein n=1 Tax=Brevundimonas goettingensis TaxID=2774190 RepID=A0A975GVD4_9CAUL|nr:excalibur calcium-binding domain-containing protein [Brevundimonas goettingensis]